MKELSIFIDESGDFGAYDFHSPFYIITMIFHDQSSPITSELQHLEEELAQLHFPNTCIHTGPIIRREDIYSNLSIKERRRIFNKMIGFIRQIDLRYKCFYIEKKQVTDVVDASGRLAKQISQFIRLHYDEFMAFDVIKAYYDNGQIEVSKILSSVFNAMLSDVEFRKVLPKDYRLFQIADLFCSMKLVDLKLTHNIFSKSEQEFFGSKRDLKKNYLKPLRAKEWL